MSSVMETISAELGTIQTFTIRHNPRENGLTERINRTLIAMLAKTTPTPMEWDQRVPFILYAYNATAHSSTGESPFYLLHGFDPNFPSKVTPNEKVTPYQVDISEYKLELLAGLKLARQLASKNLIREETSYKRQYDKRNKVKKRFSNRRPRACIYARRKKRQIQS